ncbi:Fanconi-associated nuclease 1 [Phytophthora citrophthora]|uniref:Fanconi-associated nuclease n=1 Tax=Phytophthora citrophthora TaxID=4793 RepID=A0AAD9GP96_9STRA|nr:Fanconi-associated nuclease 1 [Phytophthora citrophthora]
MDAEVKREPKLEPGLDESEKPPVWEDAYARHFSLVLSTILFKREDFRELLSSSERAIASRFLTELKPFEQQLYARLFQRQGPWFKTTSLFRYFRQAEDVKQELSGQTELREQLPVNEQVQDVIHVMIEAGFLQEFPVSAAVSPKIMKTIASKTERPLSPGTQMKQEMIRLETALDAIERCSTAPELAALYKKMTGSKKHVAKTDLMVVIRKVVKTQKRIDGSRIPVAQLMQHIWLENYPLTGRKSSDVMALRMTPETKDLLLRMHRLFYFVSTPPFNATSLMPPQLEDTGRLIELATHKLRQEPIQWPGLMVFFKKVAYPEYALTIGSSGDSTSTEMLNSHRVFPSSEVYVSYEVAYQLHRIMSVVEQCMQIVTPEKGYQEPDLDLKWMISDSTPAFLAFQRLLLILHEDGESTETEDEETSIAKTEDKADWQLRSWEQFYGEVEKMQSLDDLVLACRGCLQAYLKWMTAAAYSTSGIPAFFSKCNAGYHLVRSLHTAVGLYEKMRKYQISTLLLNELLAAPFLERKRGYWWDRLALNLEHLKCSDQARDTCVNALEDPHVLAADRTALQRRLNRLDRQKDRGETISMESLSTADLLLQSTGNSMIAPSVEDNTNADEGNAGTHTSYEYRRNHIIGRPLNRQTGEKSRFVGYDDEPCTVEQLVLQYCRGHEGSGDKLKTGGWYGVHSEGVVFGNLFGVLMWDVLYASLPNVFQTPFQSAPLDFGYADIFYETRRDLIERRLAQVKDEWTVEELLTTFVTRWNSEFGKVTRFVHWPTDALASLQFHLLAIAAVGRAQLASLLRYMATSKEFHQAQNGLPDLLLLRFELTGPEDDLVSLSPRWPIDSNGFLNIYAFCGMDEELNMNEKVSSTAVLKEEGSDETIRETKLEIQPLLHVLDLLRDTSCAQLKVVEVKGPRDRLSDKQLLWLEVLSGEVGLDASVMHVEEPEKHVKRKKKEAVSATATSAPRKRQTKRRKA